MTASVSSSARRPHRPVSDPPRWVRAILASPELAFTARVFLTLPFWWSGMVKLIGFPTTVAEMAGAGLPLPALAAVATIVVQLLGSLLVIFDRRAWLGAGMLAVFTLIATLLAHAFWRHEGAAFTAQLNVFLEHVALAAAFAIAALASLQTRILQEKGSSLM